MNKEQFIDLVNSWSDIEKTIYEYTANCTDEERVFMLNKYTENRNNTNTLLVKYITQDIPRGYKIAENLGEIWGVNSQQVAEVLMHETTKEEQAILSELDDFDFEDI